MATSTNKQYPIFEANQVLSDKHLNGLVTYLEKEERDTRTYLLGVGIACGLEINIANDRKSITISEGTAVTTEGYLIKFNGGTYFHYKDADISTDFLTKIKDETYLSAYQDLNSAHQLLENTTDSLGIISDGFLANKIVVLVIEAMLIDQKNCTTTSCDDKGLRLEFNIKPIIVNQSWVEVHFTPKEILPHFNKLFLPRFDVEKSKLVKGTDIFTAFQKAFDATKTNTSKEIATLYNHLLKINIDTENEFTLLSNISTILNNNYNLHKNTIYFQYVYDWLSDIQSAYNEIVDFNKQNPGVCCIARDLFPYHVSLGVAFTATGVIKNSVSDHHLSKYRNDSILTGFLGQDLKEKARILYDLVKRLQLIINHFKIDTSLSIKITPSSYGKISLGEKAIPFYYDINAVNELNKVWNPSLSYRFKNDEILGYHSAKYSEISEVNNPLAYEAESYNFYRIEGVIGKEFSQAIATVKSIQDNKRLPFQVIGINAVDETSRTIAFNNQGGDWDDLEVEYDLAKTKLINLLDFFVKWLNDNKGLFVGNLQILKDLPQQAQTSFTEFKKLLTADLPEFLNNYSTFYHALEAINNVFLIYNHQIDIRQAGCVNTPLIDDLERRLDEFNALVLEDSFTIIYLEAKRRWINTLRTTFLAQFAAKNASIEHKSGVTRGGTFCMIYADYSVFTTTSPKKNRLLWASLPLLTARFQLEESTIQVITSQNPLTKKKLAMKIPELDSENIDSPCEEKQTEAVQIYQSLLKENLSAQMIPEISKYLIANIQPFILNQIRTKIPPADSTPKNIVIADFYVPYICCGNGDAINIVVNTPEKPNVPIVADFSYPDFEETDFETDKPIS